MLYDQLGVRFVRLYVSLFPPEAESFPDGALSHLYAALNQHGGFDGCSERKGLGATFEGEDLTFDITPDRVKIEFRAFLEFQQGVKDRVAQLLQETNAALGEYGIEFLYLPRKVEIRALVPTGGPDAGAVIRRKLPKKLQAPELPGDVHGAGIELVGATENYRYETTMAPYLPDPSNLYLAATVQWRMESVIEDREKLSDPIDLVLDQLQATYDLVTVDLAAVAKDFLP